MHQTLGLWQKGCTVANLLGHLLHVHICCEFYSLGSPVSGSVSAATTLLWILLHWLFLLADLLENLEIILGCTCISDSLGGLLCCHLRLWALFRSYCHVRGCLRRFWTACITFLIVLNGAGVVVVDSLAFVILFDSFGERVLSGLLDLAWLVLHLGTWVDGSIFEFLGRLEVSFLAHIDLVDLFLGLLVERDWLHHIINN